HASQPSTRPVVPIVSQPISKPIELPPQYRPRKPRKQVNVACQPCRKRRSKCTGTAPCSRCVAEGNECVFDGRKDAQERNRELRNSEKALSKVFRVLKKLETGDSSSNAAFAQIKQLAENSSEFSSFARELFNLDDKTNVFDFADFDESGSVVPKHEDDARGSASWSHISPAQTGNCDITPRSANESRQSLRDVSMSETALMNSRTIPQPHPGHVNTGLKSDFGNLPFSSAIKANGYPAHIQHQQLQNLSTSAEYSMLPLHSFEQEALGRAYLSFRDATLQMIADGMPARDVLGSHDYYICLRDNEESREPRHVCKVGYYGSDGTIDEVDLVSYLRTLSEDTKTHATIAQPEIHTTQPSSRSCTSPSNPRRADDCLQR
ncbi:hypothetical protein KCU89_g12707, partial [Aureobasidium melanogenum]